MKAIQTKFLGPTNFKGSRVKAFDLDGNSTTLSYDHGLNTDEMHAKAARTLRDKMGWRGSMIGGYVKNGMVFVFSLGATFVSGDRV